MTDLSRDELFQLLSSARRRYAIHALYRGGGESTLADLADAVTREETGATAEDDVRRVQASLTATHLPRLAAVGVVEYDGDRIALSREARRCGLLGPAPVPTYWPLLYCALGVLVWTATLGIAAGVVSPGVLSYEAATVVAVAGVVSLVATRVVTERRPRALLDSVDALVE
jgi:hypothetical protein